MRKRVLHIGILVLLGIQATWAQQSKTPAEQLVEGSKVLVELLKVLSTDKEKNEATGCKGRHADLCVVNTMDSTVNVIITSRASTEVRELIITTASRECCLQLPVGVWTYELRIRASTASIRKGDLLIEGCNDVTMTIK